MNIKNPLQSIFVHFKQNKAENKIKQRFTEVCIGLIEIGFMPLANVPTNIIDTPFNIEWSVEPSCVEYSLNLDQSLLLEYTSDDGLYIPSYLMNEEGLRTIESALDALEATLTDNAAFLMNQCRIEK